MGKHRDPESFEATIAFQSNLGFPAGLSFKWLAPFCWNQVPKSQWGPKPSTKEQFIRFHSPLQLHLFKTQSVLGSGGSAFSFSAFPGSVFCTFLYRSAWFWQAPWPPFTTAWERFSSTVLFPQDFFHLTAAHTIWAYTYSSNALLQYYAGKGLLCGCTCISQICPL